METPSSEFFQRDRTQQPPALTPGYKTSVLRSPRLALWSLAELAVGGDGARCSGRTSWGRWTTT